MTARPMDRDERTVAVENASFRWAYLVLTYGLLASVAYRGYARHESSWDLLALVVLGGAVTTVYQGTHRVLSPRWALASAAAVAIAVVIAAVLAYSAPR